MACIAIKSDGKCCRNYALLEKGGEVRGFTCYSHSEYFERPEKIKRSWLKHPSLNAAYLQVDPQKREYIELALANGLVSMSKEDIQNIPCHRNANVTRQRWAYFLLLVARHTEEFRPEWNEKLWKECVGHLWYWLQAIGPVEIKKEDIQLLICLPGSLKWWYEGMYLYPEYRDRTLGFSEEQFFEFFQSCLEFDTGWAWELVSQLEEDAKMYLNGRVSKGRILDDILLKERFVEWKRGKLEDFKAICVARIFEFKEEIIATSWHPQRFLDWCVDWEEKKGFAVRWD
jgi:hypothetical protein